MSDNSLVLLSVPDIPLVKPGDDLAKIVHTALQKNNMQLVDNDIVVIAQKIVSKAENRIVDLDSVTASEQAQKLAREADKDPRQVQLILDESREVVRCKEGVIIVEHNSGVVMANAGIDHSNVDSHSGKELVSLLPEDSDKSAREIASALKRLCSVELGVIINDSVGRAWRVGTVGIALGCAGVVALKDLRGDRDLFGQELKVSETADADALAAAACLLMGEGADGSPVVIIRGHHLGRESDNVRALVRDKENDLFR